MKRLLYLVSLLALSCGCRRRHALPRVLQHCRNQGPPGRDPFFGRTTVPPPPTGAAAAAIDAYLQGGRSRMASAMPPAPRHPDVAVPTATGADPMSAGQPTNSQGWVSAGSAATGRAGAEVADLRSAGGRRAMAAPGNPGRSDFASTAAHPAPSVIRIVEPAATTQPLTAASAGAGPASGLSQMTGGLSAMPSGQPTPADNSLGAAILAGRPRVVRTLQPRSLATADPGTSPAGADTLPGHPLPAGSPTSADPGAVDIFDLPPVDRGATASNPQATAAQAASGSSGSGVGQPARLVSAEQPRGGAAPVAEAIYAQPAEFAGQARYGYDAEYRWLRGRLEYSPIDRRWKLRYIPIDGQTDRYGGSVILADESLLTGCQRGEFVEVQGRLGKHDPREGFAPQYEVSALKRLGS